MNTTALSLNEARMPKTLAPSVSQSAVLFQSTMENPGSITQALAHEIRNPLLSINLAVEMLKTIAHDDDQQKYLDIVMRCSARINGILTDLLSYPAIDKAVPEKYSIDQLLDEVLVVVEDRVTLKNIRVSRNYTSQHPVVELNRMEMKIALTNIIINAIEAMPASNGQLKIVTEFLEGACIVVIKDNGTGISKENIKSIFKPYFTSKPGGRGFGLSNTLAILNSHHVWVNVQSEIGRGTEFTLLFEKELP